MKFVLIKDYETADKIAIKDKLLRIGIPPQTAEDKAARAKARAEYIKNVTALQIGVWRQRMGLSKDG